MDQVVVHSLDMREALIPVSGTIKWFDTGKGFGFIIPDGGGGDVLLHVTCLRKSGFVEAPQGLKAIGCPSS
jgi:CspA family cold shock protein